MLHYMRYKICVEPCFKLIHLTQTEGVVRLLVYMTFSKDINCTNSVSIDSAASHTFKITCEHLFSPQLQLLTLPSSIVNWTTDLNSLKKWATVLTLLKMITKNTQRITTCWNIIWNESRRHWQSLMSGKETWLSAVSLLKPI